MQRIFFVFFLWGWILTTAFAQRMPEEKPTQPKDKPTIAVTTFENLSAFSENAWVAMSFSESLTVKLKKLYERFIVVERIRIYEVIREQGFDPEKLDSLEATKQRDLGGFIGANYLIFGSVSLQGAADNQKTPLLANMRMVDVQTGEIKEAQAIQGEMQQLFELETKLAFALLKQMGIEPTPDEAEQLNLKETLSILANKYYSLGQKAFYDGDDEMAKTLYDKAMEVLGGEYYQAAELSLIEALERQKAAADEAQMALIKAEALRRREESERKRAEANLRLFAEAKYSMLAEEYEVAIERFEQYLNLAKPFRQIKWKRDFDWQIAYRPLLHEGVARSCEERSKAIYVASFRFKNQDYVFHLDAIDPKTGETRWQFNKHEEPENANYGGTTSGFDVPQLKSPIVIVDGMIYAPMSNTHIVALDESTGELMWEFEHGKRKDAGIRFEDWPFPQSLPRSIGVTDEVVCVKFYDGALVALSAKTGEKKWQFDTGIRGVKSVLASDGRVYIGAREGLIAFSAQTGEELWRAKLGSSYTLPSPWSHTIWMDKETVEQELAELKAQFKAIPNLSEEQVKMLEQVLESRLRPFNQLDRSGLVVTGAEPPTGLRQWDMILELDGTPITDIEQLVTVIRSKEIPTTRTLTILREGEEKSLTVEETDEPPSELSPPPIIQGDSNILYVAASGMYGSVSALKKATGERLWEYHRASFPMIYELALKGERLYAYFASLLAGIDVLGKEQGELLWQAKGKPLLVNDKVYMLELLQGLNGRSLETGEIIWQAKPQGVTPTELKAVTETTVYLSSSSENLQKLHALDVKTGEELWQLPIDSSMKDVLVGEDNTVYLTTWNRLYALSPKPKGLLPEQEEHESLLGIGTALVALGRYEEAIPKLKETLELRADLTEATWQLALSHEGMHRWREAASERNEYLSRTPFASARPEVKKHLYEHLGIQKWALKGEPEFDIRRYIPDDTSNSMSMMGPGLRWGGAATLTFIEGTIHFLGSPGTEDGSHNSWPISGRSEEWGKVEVLGREAIRQMKLRIGWHSSRPWSEESYAEHFSDSGRIYMSFILMNEVGGAEYRMKSILGAFSVDTGELLWKFEADQGNRPMVIPNSEFRIPNSVHFPVLLVSDKVPPFEKGGSGGIYWGIEGRLYALDKEMGTLRWEFHDEATPQLFNRYSIDLKSSPERLLEEMKRGIDSRAKREQTFLVAAEGSVYIVDRDGLFALSAQTGKLLWKNPIPNLHSPVRVHAGRVYALAGREFYTLRADTGETDWSQKMDSDLTGYQFDEGRIYLRTQKGLHVFSAETGEAQWEFPLRSWGSTDMMIVGSKNVYLRADMLYAFDKATGEVKWGMDSFRPQQSIAGIEAQGIFYLHSAIPVVLYAFDLAQIDKLRAEGKEWWTFEWQFYRDKARSFQKRSMLQQAIAEYKEAIKRAPEPEVLWLYAELGEVYYELGNLEAAEEMYTQTGLPRETDWLVIGPFDNTDDKGRTDSYPPETEINLSASYQGKTGTVKWQKAADEQMDGKLDFTKIFTPSEWVLAYTLIDVVSPYDREAQLRIGSDDGVKVWLNGEVIWTNQVPRGLRLDQDVVPIALKKGNNRLLFEVDQGVRAWEFTFRITDTNGQPIEGLRFQAPIEN